MYAVERFITNGMPRRMYKCIYMVRKIMKNVSFFFFGEVYEFQWCFIVIL